MGKRGPKPQPDAIKKLKGNPGKRPLKESFSAWSELYGKPEPPQYLTTAQRNRYRGLVNKLASVPKLLATVDADTLANMAICLDEIAKTTEILEREGLIAETANGALMQHPAAKLRAAAQSRFHQFAVNFGLNPVARSNIALEAETGKKDKIAEYLDRINQTSAPPTIPLPKKQA